MDSQAYSQLAGITKYWYLLLIGLMFFSLVIVSVSEYRQKSRIKKEVSRFIGYLETRDKKRIGLTADNLIGSGSRADIIIESPFVSKSHALIHYTNGRLLLRPISGDTKINSRRAIREHEIFTGDVLSFGGICLTAHLNEEADSNEN